MLSMHDHLFAAKFTSVYVYFMYLFDILLILLYFYVFFLPFW